MKKIFSILALLAIAGSALFAQNREFTKKVFHASNGLDLPYQILYPENFDPNAQYPMILFLHGSGERGNDNGMQTYHGGKLFTSAEELKGVIFIAPQCPWYDYWGPVSREDGGKSYFPEDAPIQNSLEAAKELMDSFVRLGFVQTDKIYGTGLSMGGFGILDFALRFPDYFAAVQPICGGVNIDRCKAYRGHTAFRFFHGLDDKAVDPNNSINAHAVFTENGIKSELLTYPGVGHGSWNNAFAEPDFLSWFFKH